MELQIVIPLSQGASPLNSFESHPTRQSLLLKLSGSQDAEAWEQFIEIYGPSIIRWSRSLGLQDSDAADVTQMVLVKLLQVLQTWQYRPEQGRFRDWLKRVTVNVAIDLKRTWKTRGTGDTIVGRVLEGVASDSFEESLWASMEVAHCQELLSIASSIVESRVQPKTWLAYIATCLQEKPASEVAQKLEMSIGDVYVAKSRVLKMLRQEVAKLEEHPGAFPAIQSERAHGS